MKRLYMLIPLAVLLMAPFAMLSEETGAESNSEAGTAVYYSDAGLITITFNGVLPGPAEYGARVYKGYYETTTPTAAFWSNELVSLGNTHTLNLADPGSSVLKNLAKDTYSIEIYSVQEKGDPAWVHMTLSDIKSLKLTDSEIYLTPGQTYQLITQIIPTSASSTPLKWSVTSSAIAKVSDSGLVTAVSEGDTIVTVSTLDDAHTATCTVHVTSTPTVTITLSTYSVTIPVGTTFTVTATVSPQASGSVISWTSASPGIASVSGGVITGNAVGQTDVTASCQGVSATCHVTVTQGGSTVITLNPTNLSLSVGGTGKIVATVSPSTQTIAWSSSDTNVAVVLNDGTVVGVGVGTAIITAKAADGTTASAVVTISGSGGGGGQGGGQYVYGGYWFSDILALIVIALIILIIMVLLVIVIMMLRSRDRPDWYWNGYEWRRLR